MQDARAPGVRGAAERRAISAIGLQPIGPRARQNGSISKLMSMAGAECVSAPTETKSAPVAASSGMRSSVTPPEISILARPARARPPRGCRRSSCCRRESSRRQPPAPRRPASRRSRLDFDRQAGPMRARASTAASTPPARRMWLSLIRIASKSPTRWLVAPPARTAYFSSARSVGVVLRVSRMVMRPPAASTNCARARRDARQALQEIQRRALGDEQRPRRAGDDRNLFTRDAGVAVGFCGFETGSRPLGYGHLAKRFEGDVQAGEDAGRLGEKHAMRLLVARDCRVGRDVAAADILRERPPHDVAVPDRRSMADTYAARRGLVADDDDLPAARRRRSRTAARAAPHAGRLRRSASGRPSCRVA